VRPLLHILLFVLSVPAGIASAQVNDRLIEEIIAAASDACVTMTYSLDAKVNEVKVCDRGTVVAQDDLWCLKGDTLEIYTCQDGTWILYPESREAMIEPRWTYDDLKAAYKNKGNAKAVFVRLEGGEFTEMSLDWEETGIVGLLDLTE
jgi:hypothetical protein